jgi:hypothetical protein
LRFQNSVPVTSVAKNLLPIAYARVQPIFAFPKTQPMIVYNVTIKVDHAIAAEWLQWLRGEHIPEMIATGCFSGSKVLRLLETDDTDGPTYAVQYFAGSKALYNLYIEKYSAEMRERGLAKWGAGFIAFRSVMEVVN